MTSKIKLSPQADLSQIHEKLNTLKKEIASVIVGQNEMIQQVLAALLCAGHVLIEGVPGIAKTLLARAVTRCVDSRFSRIQFTADLMPSDITGTLVYNSKKSEFEFKQGPIFANMILIDEINRAPAKTQAALFEVMEECQVTVDGISRIMGQPFMIIATQNPIEYEGTYRLPEAQLDRFLFKVKAQYPLAHEEAEILKMHDERTDRDIVKNLNTILSGKEVTVLQKTVRSVRVDASLREYIADIVVKSRTHPDLYLGGSPRASLAIMDSSKAFAVMAGRDFVMPEDIQYAAYPALRHRFILTPEKEMEGRTPEDIIREIIVSIEVPR